MNTSTSAGHALWVLAHPERDSLNAALRDAGVAALRSQGWQVTESDLYAMGWEPTLVRPGGADVAAEQAKLLVADLVVLQFPLWWYGQPAILKGWIDRVFESGFGYDVVDPQTGRVRKYGDGLLTGKRALAVVTAGDRPGSLQPRGISGSIEDVLWPLLHGTFWYTGMLPLHPELITKARDLDVGQFTALRDRLVDRLAGVQSEVPIGYLPLDDDHYDHAVQLHDHIAPGEQGIAAHRDVRVPEPCLR
ncbi:NAD(P)H-dependent oxidoreductase [Microlunatus soli]|uniref:NAD(P)H dehydrogenase (Quinone) n=1 Tax=Microlunatus soli TaxID=630515 RepID=A0A1H1WG28_9ACTN|nr:NAD(P)H-dependent oxidoreductase [Microlunatus soli]SDS96034.1 NAD(P)H dehydrogenase (quinone) [Microlunatus soli]